MSGGLRPDAGSLYRLPWTAADNAFVWLEPTRNCNLGCDACFVEKDSKSHKSLDRIRHELARTLAMCRCDSVLIAGGEPLTHPGIRDIVRMVKQSGAKPVIFTNGVLLDSAMLADLKRAGAYGFTIHVDSHQPRPGWEGANEALLNKLRAQFADMLALAGGLNCAFNTTVFPDTLEYVPDIVDWAVSMPDKVHSLTLNCLRMVDTSGRYEYYAGAKRVNLSGSPYAQARKQENLVTEDIYRQIKKALPGFEFCAFLGGTANPLSLKWVIGLQVSSKKRVYGNAGPRAMEIIQTGYHAVKESYLGYTSPRASGMGKLTLLLALLDPELRKTLRRYISCVFSNPQELSRRLYVQSITVTQPMDILDSGEQDMCDGCPNKTYWEERLVPACRLNEYRRFGTSLRIVPRSKKKR